MPLVSNLKRTLYDTHVTFLRLKNWLFCHSLLLTALLAIGATYLCRGGRVHSKWFWMKDSPAGQFLLLSLTRWH